MTDAINTQNRLQNNAVKADARAKTNAGEDGASQQGKKAESSTIVNLTSSKVLQSLSDRIQQLPEINSAKVESVKQALANGEYKADAEVIAKKFSEIEKLLP
jgi:negative regulator of flagellin synthesis FlgM